MNAPGDGQSDADPPADRPEGPEAPGELPADAGVSRPPPLWPAVIGAASIVVAIESAISLPILYAEPWCRVFAPRWVFWPPCEQAIAVRAGLSLLLLAGGVSLYLGRLRGVTVICAYAVLRVGTAILVPFDFTVRAVGPWLCLPPKLLSTTPSLYLLLMLACLGLWHVFAILEAGYAAFLLVFFLRRRIKAQVRSWRDAGFSAIPRASLTRKPAAMGMVSVLLAAEALLTLSACPVGSALRRAIRECEQPWPQPSFAFLDGSVRSSDWAVALPFALACLLLLLGGRALAKDLRRGVLLHKVCVVFVYLSAALFVPAHAFLGVRRIEPGEILICLPDIVMFLAYPLCVVCWGGSARWQEHLARTPAPARAPEDSRD